MTVNEMIFIQSIDNRKKATKVNRFC